MIIHETPLGLIQISDDYFKALVSHVVSDCYGVRGLALKGVGKYLARLTGGDAVRIRHAGNKLIIDVHIAVTYGMNISAIVKSIVNKVTFTVEQATGLEVVKVNVFVDEVKAE